MWEVLSLLDSIVDGNNPLRATGKVVQTPARLRLRPLPLDGRGHFLVLSWSNSCYLGFQSAVLVAIRAAEFQAVTKRKCTVTAEVASSSLVVPAIFSITCGEPRKTSGSFCVQISLGAVHARRVPRNESKNAIANTNY